MINDILLFFCVTFGLTPDSLRTHFGLTSDFGLTSGVRRSKHLVKVVI